MIGKCKVDPSNIVDMAWFILERLLPYLKEADSRMKPVEYS